MGLCKCRKATNLYCFHHNKHVCPTCLVADHAICVVNTYLRWVQDSDYEWPPKCVVCKQVVTEGNAIRLMCLDLVHPMCLDAHARNALEGNPNAVPSCPACELPFVPTAEVKTEIARLLREHLNQTDWAQAPHIKAVLGDATNVSTLSAAAAGSQTPVALSRTGNGTTAPKLPASAPVVRSVPMTELGNRSSEDGMGGTTPTHTPPPTHTPTVTNAGAFPSSSLYLPGARSVASRKGRDGSASSIDTTPDRHADEDKYHPSRFRVIRSALGKVNTTVDVKRMLLFIGALSTLSTVVVIYFFSQSSETST